MSLGVEVNLGFEFVAAVPKRLRDDPETAPTRERMTTERIRRNPDSDQKRARHQQSRQQSAVTKESTMQTEAALIAKMAAATTLSEQRGFAAELAALRENTVSGFRAEASLDLATKAVTSRYPTMATTSFTRHSAATDWMGEVEPDSHDARSVEASMRAEATVWYKARPDFVRGDGSELAAQAIGMARRLASQYGASAEGAAQSFMETVAHLNHVEAKRKVALDTVQPGPYQVPSGSSLPLAPENKDTFDDSLSTPADPKSTTNTGTAPSLSAGDSPAGDTAGTTANPAADAKQDKSGGNGPATDGLDGTQYPWVDGGPSDGSFSDDGPPAAPGDSPGDQKGTPKTSKIAKICGSCNGAAREARNKCYNPSCVKGQVPNSDHYDPSKTSNKTAGTSHMECGSCGHKWTTKAQYNFKCPECGAEESVHPVGQTPYSNKRNLSSISVETMVNSVMAWESGTMAPRHEAGFFQHLISTGMAWQLQPAYAARANALIATGACHVADGGSFPAGTDKVPSLNEGDSPDGDHAEPFLQSPVPNGDHSGGSSDAIDGLDGTVYPKQSTRRTALDKDVGYDAHDDSDDDGYLSDPDERTSGERFGEDDNRDAETRAHDNYDPYEASRHTAGPDDKQSKDSDNDDAPDDHETRDESGSSDDEDDDDGDDGSKDYKDDEGDFEFNFEKKKSSRRTAGEVPEAFKKQWDKDSDGGDSKDSDDDSDDSKGDDKGDDDMPDFIKKKIEDKKSSRRTAGDEGGSTCSVCGDKIEKDPSGEANAGYHHDNGSKHDHEAKPGGGSKESAYQRISCGQCKGKGKFLGAKCDTCGGKGYFKAQNDKPLLQSMINPAFAARVQASLRQSSN